MGFPDGLLVGFTDGLVEGSLLGLALGLAVGLRLGETNGLADGDTDGLADGDADGLARGLLDGFALGLSLGLALGFAVELSTAHLQQNCVSLISFVLQASLLPKLERQLNVGLKIQFPAVLHVALKSSSVCSRQSSPTLPNPEHVPSAAAHVASHVSPAAPKRYATGDAALGTAAVGLSHLQQNCVPLTKFVLHASLVPKLARQRSFGLNIQLLALLHVLLKSASSVYSPQSSPTLPDPAHVPPTAAQAVSQVSPTPPKW